MMLVQWCLALAALLVAVPDNVSSAPFPGKSDGSVNGYKSTPEPNFSQLLSQGLGQGINSGDSNPGGLPSNQLLSLQYNPFGNLNNGILYSPYNQNRNPYGLNPNPLNPNPFNPQPLNPSPYQTGYLISTGYNPYIGYRPGNQQPNPYSPYVPQPTEHPWYSFLDPLHIFSKK